jgi:hypothetical protein
MTTPKTTHEILGGSMYKLMVFFLISLLLSLVAGAELVNAQFDGPESAAYDAIRHRYFINNIYTGSIIEIDSLGQTSDYHTDYRRYYGNHISGDSLYFTANEYYLVGIDMSTELPFLSKSIASWNNLDGVCTDTSGNVYVVDTGGRIMKVKLSDQSVEQLASVPPATQDVTFDKINNRLIVGCFTGSMAVRAVDIETGQVTVLVSSGAGFIDGIMQDDRGNTYVSSYSGPGYLIRFDSTFSSRDTIASDLNEPTGPCYNTRDQIIVVGDFGGDTVHFIADPFYLDDDSDGTINGTDNCRNTYNPDQEDTDSDSVGDSCDNCVARNNPFQEDDDGDGAGDSCDICPGFDDFTDLDTDLAPDSCDNCPFKFNPSQADSNSDGIGDACDFICGDADRSGSIDIDDAVYLVTYIFASGPPPEPMSAGDADCSEAIDIDDVVYLISYIFAGGSVPCDADGDGVPDC